MARSGRDSTAPKPERNGTLGAAAAEGQPVPLCVLLFEGAREPGGIFAAGKRSEGRKCRLGAELRALVPPGWLVKSCRNIEEGIAALAKKRRSARTSQPQCVGVVDLGLDGGGGIHFVRRLRAAAPDLPILALSEEERAHALEALMAGASGHLYGPHSAGQVLTALECMARGQAVLCQRSEKAIVRTLWIAGSFEAARRLTVRQQEVMSGLLRGLLNKEIGSEMGVAEGTVHSQLEEIFRKLEVHSRTEAVRKYLRL
jgi:NarL family two-component system response regulator LiaR